MRRVVIFLVGILAAIVRIFDRATVFAVTRGTPEVSNSNF